MEIEALISCLPGRDAGQCRKMSNSQATADITLFLTAALAGESIANIRAITASDLGSLINLRFIFYKAPSADEIEIMGYIGTEFLSNYNEKISNERYEVIPDGSIPLGRSEFIAYEKG